MKTLMTLLFTVTILSNAYADQGRALLNPSDTLRSNECIFKQSNIHEKKIPQLLDYDYIINSCDAKPTSSLIIWADHMKEGYCAYDLVQKMTGYTIARIMKPCPVMQEQFKSQNDIQNINDDDFAAMTPALTKEDIKAKQAKKVITKQKSTKTEKTKEKNNDKGYLPPQGVDTDF